MGGWPSWLKITIVIKGLYPPQLAAGKAIEQTAESASAGCDQETGTSRLMGRPMTTAKTGCFRRGMLQTTGGAMLAGAVGICKAGALGMPLEGPDTPKLSIYISADPTVS